MELLERLHLVKHVHMDHRHRHYTPVGGGHCHHLVCSDCGLVVEFSDCQVERLTRTLARRTKFRIEGHCMDFFGRCQDCSRRWPKPGRGNGRES
jgi:Fur family ferric uptake transcriptional regulator